MLYRGREDRRRRDHNDCGSVCNSAIMFEIQNDAFDSNTTVDSIKFILSTFHKWTKAGREKRKRTIKRANGLQLENFVDRSSKHCNGYIDR